MRALVWRGRGSVAAPSRADELAGAAERLVLSPKTVDHHVSAVLAKLSVRTRREVAAAAARVGLDLKDGVAATTT